MSKFLGSPIVAVASIVMLAWGGVEFYQYVVVPHARTWFGGL